MNTIMPQFHAIVTVVKIQNLWNIEAISLQNTIQKQYTQGRKP